MSPNASRWRSTTLARSDVGSTSERTTPVSAVELAEIFTRLLGREVKPSVGSLLVIKTVGTIGGLFLPFMRDMMAMGRYFETGKYVADTKLQGELFGPVPTIEDTARRALADLELVPRAA